jgi:signal transduction histidine kinase
MQDERAMDHGFSGAAPTRAPARLLAQWSSFRRTLSGIASDGLQRRIYIAAIVVGALLLALVSRSVFETNRLIRQTLQQELSTHTQAISLSLSESLNLADFTAKQARKQWLQEGRLKSHPDYIDDFPNFKDLISQVAVIDRHGYLAASSLRPVVNPVYLGDRAHFRVHADNPQNDAVFVSEPVVGRVSKTRGVQFTRPIRDQHQQFSGVVVISLNPDYIEKNLFDQIGRPQHSVLLMGQDGRLRVSANSLANEAPSVPTGADPPPTNANAKAPLDAQWHEQHVWETQALDEYSLVLHVGLPKSEMERQTARTFAWAVGAYVIILLSGAFYVQRLLLLVHDRNRILQKLEDSQIKANSASAMKSKFVSSISHELRTPLNGILGFSELVGMSQDLDEAKRYGLIVNKSATHLHQLVNTLLDLAKIEAGQMEVVCIHSDVREICDSVVSLHRYSVEKKGLMLDVNYEPDLPKTIYTDHIKLMQILNNMLSNAAKFTDDGAIFLTVSLEQGQWSFSVADTGIGMTPQQLENIFTRFNNIKLDDFDSAARPGAGLGMALCKELVELMGGSIKVFSEPKVGTVVKVFLPDRHASANV